MSFLDGWTFTRASAAFGVVNGVLVSAAVNTPRFTDYGLLIEPARTNLLLRSQEFDNASWTKTNCTVTANAAAAPDGTTTADKLVGASGTSAQRVSQAVACTIGVRQTVSVFAKVIAGETRWVYFRLSEGAAPVLWFDLQAAAIGTAETGWLDPQLEALAGGWYRLSASFVATAATHTIRYGPCDSGTSASFTGNGSKGFYIWGAQWELAPDLSSYVATTSASVTRSADQASRAFVPGAFGFAYVEFVNPRVQNISTVTVLGANIGSPIYVSDGAVGTSNGTVALPSGAVATTGEIVRSVFAWDVNGRKVCVNGSLAEDANGIGAITSLTLGELNSYVRNLALGDGIPLSDEACQTMTGGTVTLTASELVLDSAEATGATLKSLTALFDGEERVFVGQQGSDISPGAGIVGVESGDGLKRMEMTFYQYGATLRTWGSQMLELFINDDPSGVASFSVRGNGATGGARIEARDGTDSYSIASLAFGADRVCLLATGSSATTPPLPQDMSIVHMRSDGFFRFAVGTDDQGASGTEVARIGEEGLRLKQRATAPTPPTGYTVIWAKTDGTVQKTSNVGGVTTTAQL